MSETETASSEPQSEADFNGLFCAEVGGEQETRHDYTYGEGQTAYVVVDCETPTMVWEGGLDKRSSLDSLQQAMFFAAITDKEPGIVIYDTDGVEGPYEHQIRTTADLLGIEFISYDWEEGLPDEPEEPAVGEIVLPDVPGFPFDFGW